MGFWPLEEFSRGRVFPPSVCTFGSCFSVIVCVFDEAGGWPLVETMGAFFAATAAASAASGGRAGGSAPWAAARTGSATSTAAPRAANTRASESCEVEERIALGHFSHMPDRGHIQDINRSRIINNL
jgi:hypothetical protein